MEMTKAIISGSATALSLVKTLLTTPLIYERGRPDLAVPLEVESFSQSGTAEVSENLIITANSSEETEDGSKKYFVDNVAPSGWTWNLQGYITGISALEPTNFFPWAVIINTGMLKKFFRKGAILTFKDICCKRHTAVIESLDLTWEADCANKQPFSMTLKEINIMAGAEINTLEKNATPDVGSSNGKAGGYGTTTTESAYKSVLKSNFDGDEGTVVDTFHKAFGK